MKSESHAAHLKELNPLDIVCFHIGGHGEYGPIDAITRKFPKRTVVVVFEGRSSDEDVKVQEIYGEKGVRTILVNSIISDKVGTEHFYINKHTASSSIFKPAAGALNEHFCLVPGVKTWGENTVVDYEADFPSITLDHFTQNNPTLQPDVLSIDAQGAELRIMEGGRAAIAKGVLTVIAEVEFIEIYAGQSLFHEQFAFLKRLDFRLADILSQQFWHPGPVAGAGFLSVGEALFFRDAEAYSRQTDAPPDTKVAKLVKQAAVALCFNRTSLVYRILDLLMKSHQQQTLAMLSGQDDLKVLIEIYRHIERNLQRYEQNNKCFWADETLFALTGNTGEGRKIMVRWESLRSLTRLVETSLGETKRFLRRLRGKLQVPPGTRPLSHLDVLRHRSQIK